MYFDSFAAFLHMDGHGVFVWSVYGSAVLVMSLLSYLPLKRKKSTLAALASTLESCALSNSSESH